MNRIITLLTGLLWLGALSSPAQSVSSLRNSGKRKMLAKQYPAAIADFTAALQQAPDDLQLLAYRAEALHGAGQPAQAVRDMDRYVELAPYNLEARSFRGGLNMELKAYDKVVADCDAVLKLQPNSYPHLANRGVARAYLQDSLGAFADLDRALKLAPAASDVRLNRGWAHYLFRHYRAAWNDLTTHLERNPKDALAYYDRAQVALALGDKPQARRDAEAALRLEPANPEVAALLASLRGEPTTTP
jgi:tetratricopeptide (TPR) repeat protein